MDIRFINPPSYLKSSIKEFWIWKGVNVRELPWILPSYECEMVFHLGNPPIVETENKEIFPLPKIHLVGPQTRRWRILSETDISLFAIRFFVGGMYSLFSKRGDEIQNQFLEIGNKSTLDDVLKLDHSSENEISEFLTSFLKDYPGINSEIPTYVRFSLLELMHPATSIQNLCKKIGISRKQLDRKFKEIVGMNPSEYRTVHRLLEMVRNPEHYRKNNPDLRFTELAQEFEYSDQSHFNRDFKRISGSIPNEWFAEYKKMSHFYNQDSSYNDRMNT
ncbi:AraC family transcriptional regulator [Leptospira congkakensis]|uniref:AraC family transcriptional regulator n=1 Tax=Leptospira congkakensis TaxID=2484932 RepID=A0A4Z1AAW7_9LEPT|nr:helix-turn-helix domain-containing protein [Leptospira congkakensis]TGL88740.1 AraC family transcriptional regulator [Leptospira congkakensis]TGL89326.1 AraC family transcriptional regulator [Leptospira congkakensis]TGL97294.1 AraC family transcriptional regulator [Leptospira congkakensis]